VNDPTGLAPSQDPQSPEAYARAWMSYRRRWRVVILAAVTVPLFAMVSDSFIPAQANGTVPGGLLGFLVALPIYMIAGLGLAAWQCPRCHHDFFMNDDGWHYAWRSRCVKCGLPKWSTDANAPRA
jgi:ribosomal protein S27AE